MNYHKILSSAAILMLLGGTAQADFSYHTSGGFIKNTAEGTNTAFDTNHAYVGTDETLEGSTVVNTILEWGTPSNSDNRRSSLEAGNLSGTLTLGTPVTFGTLIHHNYTIDSDGGSLIFVKVARELNITNNDTGESFERTFTGDFYNWETSNNANPCPAEWTPPNYVFPKTLTNGETHHIFAQGPGDHPCWDAHDTRANPGQDFTWITGNKVYNIDISGFYNSNDELVHTFWSPEGGESTGYLKLVLTLVGDANGTIGDTLWVDLNNNGIQDDPPHPTANILVQLFDSSDLSNPIKTTHTDTNGHYTFTEVNATVNGTPEYVVKFVFPPNFTGRFEFTTKNAGSDDTNDSDVNPDGATDPFSLDPANPKNMTIDAGIKFGAITGYVWNDLDEDGIQDAGEHPFPYLVTVYLYKAGQTGVFATTQTDANGHYIFEPLPEGTYTVQFVLQSGYLFSPKNAGSDPTKDSDADSTGSTGPIITVALDPNHPDNHFENIDAGMYPRISSVLFDKTTNGVDAGTGSGPYITVGDTVLWSYQITNNGNVPLMDITVTDDKEGVIDCPERTLAVNETMICSKTGTAQEGWYENIGTVTAITGDESSIEMSNLSHYTGEVPNPPVTYPSLIIEKTTNGQDADTGTGPEITVGDPITWNYHVHNNGDTMMYNIVVTDDKEGTVTCPKTSLNAGEHMDCTVNGVAVAGPYENTGTVTATYGRENQQQFTATDTSHYTGTEEGENCPCNDVHSDGSDAMGTIGMIAMMLMTLFAALFFMRREEQFNTIEK